MGTCISGAWLQVCWQPLLMTILLLIKQVRLWHVQLMERSAAFSVGLFLRLAAWVDLQAALADCCAAYLRLLLDSRAQQSWPCD